MASLERDGFSLTLSDDLAWIDEYQWTPVEQTKEYLSEGALAIQEGTKQAGRPITLEGGQFVFESHDVVVALVDELAISAGKHYTLTLVDGRTFTVVFDHEKGAIDGPVPEFFRKRTHDANTLHSLTLRFITV